MSRFGVSSVAWRGVCAAFVVCVAALGCSAKDADGRDAGSGAPTGGAAGIGVGVSGAGGLAAGSGAAGDGTSVGAAGAAGAAGNGIGGAAGTNAISVGDGCDVQIDRGTTVTTGLEWEWTKGPSYVTPLVANLTDDNADGKIDLSDTPDVVINALSGEFAASIGTLYILDGKTGNEHFHIDGVSTDATPALGDIDDDGYVDIVAVARVDTDTTQRLRMVAFKHDGTPLWKTPSPIFENCEWTAAVSIADLDADGTPEVLSTCAVYDNEGTPLWTADKVVFAHQYASPTAIDLDEDGKLEVTWGPVAYRHDGTLYYENTEVMNATVTEAENYRSFFVAVADLDLDDAPDIVVSTQHVLYVLDRAGKTVRKVNLYADEATASAHMLAFPPALADLDGDGAPEILVGNGIEFIAFDAQLKQRWAMPVMDHSGIAAGTAFDFEGDGISEAMYADERTLWTFDGLDGAVLFQRSRTSGTLIEYPTVADIDNDGEAEVLIVSTLPFNPDVERQGVQVYASTGSKWVPARRIFNQDAYHVTNVNEDGSIPQHEEPHWRRNNTFRAQAQVDDEGTFCVPLGPD